MLVTFSIYIEKYCSILDINKNMYFNTELYDKHIFDIVQNDSNNLNKL